jgi:hypothetical protein
MYVEDVRVFSRLTFQQQSCISSSESNRPIHSKAFTPCLSIVEGCCSHVIVYVLQKSSTRMLAARFLAIFPVRPNRVKFRAIRYYT